MPKILITLILLTFRIVFIIAQESVLTKSQNFYNLLQNSGISCQKEQLTSFETEAFPFNITVTIPSDVKNTAYSSERDNLIFSFTQEFAIKNSISIIDFIQKLEQKKLPYDVELFFSVNDDTPLSPDVEKYNKGGTAFYISSNDKSDSSFAIVFEEEESDIIKIISGSTDIAPLWLVKSVKEACLENSSRRIYSSSFFVFYSNGFFKENRRVSSFLEEHIPALGITSDGSRETFDILLAAADKLAVENKSNWERHYDFFTIGRKTFCLNENIFSSFYIILALIIFAMLCFLTFRGSNKFRIRLRAVLRIWYIIPEFVILNYAVFYFTSLLFSITSLAPQVIFPLVFLISLFLPVVIINIQIQRNVKKYNLSVGILMLLSGIINVFIFAYFDISLIILFFIEYLILLFSAYVRNPLLLILILFAQLVPFVPYTIDFLNFASVNGLKKMLTPNILRTFVYSTIIFTFQLQIIRIIISLQKYSQRTIVINKQKFRARIFIIILSFVFCAFFIFSVSILFKTSYSSEEKITYSVKESPAEHIGCSVSNSPFMELTNHTLIINSSVDVLRYIVKIEEEKSVPLYDSNFSYTLINPRTASFSLPDNPGRQIEIVYVTDSSTKNRITIDAYYPINKNTTGKETLTIEDR